ncbi:RNA polymerase sigma-70 factor (ECF subfamily) [Actinoplanes octamycinicus]|uniref:RNA polymerase sigma-70 factor (ECF subfamily) n=1 Tax=Actinoplanes octamycinicus TaxID=135948 RepID=A0A7W7H1C4_9ACTN|nr:sigma-70 family RNA polymerase sigma factor [Actinoplanes octamycinicus]MBB4742206.1 RNA polymerase sigma-70 factor (ECF subfamily) [Actinoplanes octamycinicus]
MVETAPSDSALPGDVVIVARLRARDETMFAELIDAWSPGMLRAARAYVADEHSAHDVVQETWLGVLRGVDRFEARSSLRTWVYRILINKARTRGVRDARTVPVGDLGTTGDDHGPTVDPARFRGAGDPYPGHWHSSPPAWPSPEDGAVAAETRRELAAALAGLPARQRVVVTLRDVTGHSGDEVCELLSISAANQRVLLHRGRAALRAALERRWAEEARS